MIVSGGIMTGGHEGGAEYSPMAR
jgi:hypothetical protein